MKRREFLLRSACTAGAAWLHSSVFPQRTSALSLKPLPRKFSASDNITLGKTGIQTSRLAMGTGTVGSGHHSHQTALGVQGLSELLLNGYEHGLRFLIPPIATAAIRTSPKPSSMFRATKSPFSQKLGHATPHLLVPISIDSAANSAPITSTSVSCTA